MQGQVMVAQRFEAIEDGPSDDRLRVTQFPAPLAIGDYKPSPYIDRPGRDLTAAWFAISIPTEFAPAHRQSPARPA